LNNKILIVDDESDVRNILNIFVTQNGYEALLAKNAEEAIEILSKDNIDLVISDIKMPGLNGIELLKFIKKNWKDIEVIIITGYQSLSTAKDALHWGAYDYISKPLDINKVLNIIQRAFQGRRLKKEKEVLLENLEQKNLELEKAVEELNLKKQELDSMVEDLRITLDITQKISTSIIDQSSLDSLTPYMHKLFDCYAWGMLNVNQEFESTIKGDLDIFLRYDLPEENISQIREDIEDAYQKYGEIISLNLNVSSQNIIGKAPDCETDCQINHLPMRSQDKIYGIAFIYSSLEKFSDKKLDLFSIITRQLATLKDASLLAKMEELSNTDPLTGLYNRRCINKELEQEFYRTQRYKTAFAFGIIDVDDFKKVNDNYGHPAGDQVLKQLSTLMRNCSRYTDIIGRYGGEEFAFILPSTDFRGAYSFGEKLRKKVSENEFDLGNGLKKKITISIGIAYFSADSHMNLEELISKADEKLYDAKRNGKNSTKIYKNGSLLEPENIYE